MVRPSLSNFLPHRLSKRIGGRDRNIRLGISSIDLLNAIKMFWAESVHVSKNETLINVQVYPRMGDS
jgi:hypothetical protein